MAEYIVTLADGADAARASQALIRAGFVVRNVLGDLGMIIGETDPGMISRLQDLPEVIAIEPSEEIQLPSPDDDLQ